MLYFAYGSNLHPARLKGRVPGVELSGQGVVSGRRLVFHKKGQDGSGKCDIESAGPSERVYGALYRIEPRHWSDLCRIEGVGHGYDDLTVTVQTDTGGVSAHTFVAQQPYIQPDLAPFDWYHALVVEGARFHSFPADYIERINAIRSVVDEDAARTAASWRLVRTLQNT